MASKEEAAESGCRCEYREKFLKLRETYDQQKANLQQAAVIGKSLLEENSQLKHEVLKATQKFELVVQDKHELEMKLELACKSQSSVAQENETLRESVQELEEELEALQASEKERARKENLLLSQVEQLKVELALEKERFTFKCEEMDTALTHASSNRREVRVEADCGHEMELLALHEQLQGAEDTKKVLEQDLGEARQKIGVVQASENRLRGQLAELETQIDEKERQLATMENLLEEKRMENLELQGQLEAERVSCVDPDKRGNSLFGEIEDRRQQAERQLAKLRILYDSLVKKNQSLQTQNVNLKNEITILSFGSSGRDRSEYVAQLNMLISEQKSQNERLLRTVGQLQDQLREREKALPPMSAIQGLWVKEMIEEHKTEVKRLEEKLNDEIMGRICFTERTQDLLKKLDDTEGQLRQARGEIARLKMQMDSLSRNKEQAADGESPKPTTTSTGPVAEKLPLTVMLPVGINKENVSANPVWEIPKKAATEAPESGSGNKQRVCFNPEVKIASEGAAVETGKLNVEEKGMKLKTQKNSGARKVDMIYVPPPEPGQPECKTQ